MKNLFAFILMFLPVMAYSETLILLVDMSHSISVEEEKLQTDGYVSALTNIQGIDGINFEVVYFNEFTKHISSGSKQNAIRAFNYHTRPDGHTTCLIHALEYVELMIDSLPRPITLDISGDGSDNCVHLYADIHRKVDVVLDRLENKGVTINTLSISDTSEEKEDISLYYSQMVRNGGFHIHVEDFMQFEGAVYQKIVREIAMMQMSNKKG